MKKYSRKNMIAMMIASSVTTAALTLAITGNSIIDAQSQYSCDVNGDGKVNVTDFNILKQELFKMMPDKMPVSPPGEGKFTEECRIAVNIFYNQLAEASTGKYPDDDETAASWITEMGEKYKWNIMSSAGYAYTDLNDDGILDLIIGEIEDKENNTGSSFAVAYASDRTETVKVILPEGEKETDALKEPLRFTPFTEVNEFSKVYVERGRRFPISLMYGYRSDENKPENTIFMALDDISEFKLYDVPFGDKLSENQIYSFNQKMPAGYAIDAGVKYIGDTPNIAYSYVDKNGELHAYYVEISGKDSSIYQVEITDPDVLA